MCMNCELTDMFDMGSKWRKGFEMFCDVRDVSEVTVELLKKMQILEVWLMKTNLNSPTIAPKTI